MKLMKFNMIFKKVKEFIMKNFLQVLSAFIILIIIILIHGCFGTEAVEMIDYEAEILKCEQEISFYTTMKTNAHQMAESARSYMALIVYVPSSMDVNTLGLSSTIPESHSPVSFMQNEVFLIYPLPVRTTPSASVMVKTAASLPSDSITFLSTESVYGATGPSGSSPSGSTFPEHAAIMAATGIINKEKYDFIVLNDFLE